MPRRNLVHLVCNIFTLTVKMSNISDKHCFKPSYLDKSGLSRTYRQTGVFLDKNTGLENSLLINKTNQNTFNRELQATHSSENFQMNQTFKIPDLGNLPVKKSTVKSLCPRQTIKPNMVKDLKQSQQSKVSLIPRPSFLTSRKSVPSSRSAQLNARKKLLKQMVFLHECNVKGRKELKTPTPVKMLAGLTPKKTPRSGGYFLLPEFNKKVQKLEDIRTPIRDLVKKEIFPNSTKSTAPSEKENEMSPYLLHDKNTSDFIKKPKEVIMQIKNLPEQRFSELLKKCKIFNAEVNEIYEKLKVVDSIFENKIKDLPEYRIYNEFCFYKTRKEDLYQKLHKLEANFTNFASTNTKIGKELAMYLVKKQEVLEKHVSVLRGFEQAVVSALEECEKNIVEVKNEKQTQPEAESPKLRRSLRLAKIKKSKFEEKSPLSKRLRKLDTKSKRIQKV